MDSNDVNLNILNRLVKELNDQLKICNALKQSNQEDYVVELSKATGLASAISLEASALYGDFSKLFKVGTSPGFNELDALTSLLQGTKLPTKN